MSLLHKRSAVGPGSGGGGTGGADRGDRLAVSFLGQRLRRFTCSLRRLWAVAKSNHSPLHAAMPRRDIVVNFWQLLICPTTGSTVGRAVCSRPCRAVRACCLSSAFQISARAFVAPGVQTSATPAARWRSCGTNILGSWFRGTPPRERPWCWPLATARWGSRGTHPAALGISQQVRPRPGRLPVPVGQGDQLLAAVGADPDHDQQAQPLVLEADVDVHTVRPDLDVDHAGQVPGVEGWRSS
jgi:hypothetical protein